MKFVLILILAAKGGSGMNMWSQPAVTTATFETQAACEAAADVFRKNAHQIERESGLQYVKVMAMCLPQG